MRKFDLQELLKMKNHLICGCKVLVGGGGNREGATHVALCNDIRSYFGHWCKVLAHVADLDAKMPRGEEAKFLSKEDTKLLSHYGTKVVSERNSINNRHSEGNNNLIPKNLMTSNQLDFSLNAQDDDNILTETIHSPLTTHHSLKKAAFTLAEVLITLGIIGIVAALTIPSLIQKHQEKVTVTRLKQTYSIFSQAVELAQIDYGDINFWSDEASQDEQELVDLFYNRITSHIDIVKNCEASDVYSFCKDLSVKYKTLDGQRTSVTAMTAHSGILKNGVIFSIYLRRSGDKWWGSYAMITVDINGEAGPNVINKDVFAFLIADYSSDWGKYEKPTVYPDGYFYNFDQCLTLFNSKCTAWVLKYENMDYLHCPDKLSEDGKHSCKE